jgi:hypothetical protein
MNDERILRPNGEPGLSHVPFNYDGQILGTLREDQIPRFFGALTDPRSLPVADFPFSTLTAMQDRVSTEKVEAIRNSPDKSGKKPLVVVHDGKSYLADGHHRAVAQWLDGDESLKAHYKDISPVSSLVKSADVRIYKTSDELRLVFGFASVISKDGMVVIDTQADTIDATELLKATTVYMEKSRHAKMMHVGGKIGEVVHSFPLTEDIAKSLGVTTDQYGWIVGMKVHSDEVWDMVKSGQLQSFSIGGSATRVVE